MASNKKTNTEKKKFTGKINAFSLAFPEPIPRIREIPSKEIINWGTDNRYINFLIELAHSSALHGAIIKAMTRQVAGQGIRIKNNIEDVALQRYINMCNSDGESLYKVMRKFIADYIISGGFTSCEVWNRGQTSFDLHHTDISNVRSTKKDKATGKVYKYLLCDDWTNQYSAEKTMEAVPAFNIDLREGTQIKLHMEYFPGSTYYPTPHYSSGILAACNDYKIMEFHSQNLDGGFVPSIIANFTSGIPTEEEAQNLYQDLVQQYTGTNKKTAKLIMNFNESPETKTEFTVLNPSNADKQYVDMLNNILTEILASHGVVNGELCGIASPGKLGTSEYLESWDLYYKDVILPKQRFIEDEINELLICAGFTNQIEIIPMEKLAFNIDPAIMSKAITINEMRKLINKIYDTNLEHLEGGDVIVEPSRITEVGKGELPIAIEAPDAKPETPQQMRLTDVKFPITKKNIKIS